MSYMYSAEFAPAAGIQELSGLEVDQVAGGPGPLGLGLVVIAAAKACSKNTTCRTAAKGAVLAGAATASGFFGAAGEDLYNWVSGK